MTPLDRRLSLEFRRTLLVQLGLGVAVSAAGCSGPRIPTDDAGVTTNANSGSGSDEAQDESEDASSGSGSDSGSESASTVGSESESDDRGDASEEDASTGEPKLDAPPETGDCHHWEEYWSVEEVSEVYPECTFDLSEIFDPWFGKICVPVDEGESCESVCTEAQGICGDLVACGFWGDINAVQVCGPYFDAELDMCCSAVAYEALPPIGRPFVDASGQPRVAQVARVQTGAGPGMKPGVKAEQRDRELDAPTRGRLAAHWLEMARGEHASVASFARFAAQLQAVGAPPQLVGEAIAAGADEVRHAQICLELARSYGAELPQGDASHSRSREFGPLALERVYHPRGASLEAVVCAAVREGCVDETLAAHEAAQLAGLARRSGRDRALAEALETIARDEARHAALAWRFVGWALEAHPELRGAVVRELEAHGRAPGRERARRGSSGWASLLAYGCASGPERQDLRALGVVEVLRPCASAMLLAA